MWNLSRLNLNGIWTRSNCNLNLKDSTLADSNWKHWITEINRLLDKTYTVEVQTLKGKVVFVTFRYYCHI